MRRPGINLRLLVIIFLVFNFLIGCQSPNISSQATDNTNLPATPTEEPPTPESINDESLDTPSATAVADTSSDLPPSSPTPTMTATPTPADQTSTNRDSVVIVQTNSTDYQTNQEIVVTAFNGLADPITTIDQQGFCSIFRLERKEDTVWTEVRNCLSGPPPQDVIIAAGDSVTTTFPSALDPGTYRVGLIYTPGDRFIAGDNNAAYSQPFQVR